MWGLRHIQQAFLPPAESLSETYEFVHGRCNIYTLYGGIPLHDVEAVGSAQGNLGFLALSYL